MGTTPGPVPESPGDCRPRARPSDHLYLVLAALGLLQVPTTIQVSGVDVAVCYAAAILCFTYLIASGNQGRFTPWLGRASRSRVHPSAPTQHSAIDHHRAEPS